MNISINNLINLLILIIFASIISLIIIKTFEKLNFFPNKIQNLEGFDYVYNYNPNIESFDNINSLDLDIRKKYDPIKMNKYVWVYWENIKTDKYPTYIKLCLDTIKKKLGKYQLIILNEKNIKKFLPHIRKDFDNLMIAQKVDYYRIALLYKYGGIWIDADVIIMKDLKPIFDKLEEGYDYVGFGCTGYQCNNGYMKPSNWVIGTRPFSPLMKLCLDKLDKKLNLRNKNNKTTDQTYHDYGKLIIWESLIDLQKLGYDYYHFTSEYDGTRDKNKYWVHSPNFFKTYETNFLDEDKLLFVVLYNSEISNEKSYQWIRTCDEDRLINGKEFLCKLFKKALKN